MNIRYVQVKPIWESVMENRIANHIGVPYKAPPISGGVKRLNQN